MRDDMFPVYAQGARCGHIEGKGARGAGEELQLSNEAAENQGKHSREWRAHWSAGYRYGYMMRVNGDALDQWIVDAPLPSTEGK